MPQKAKGVRVEKKAGKRGSQRLALKHEIKRPRAGGIAAAE